MPLQCWGNHLATGIFQITFVYSTPEHSVQLQSHLWWAMCSTASWLPNGREIRGAVIPSPLLHSSSLRPVTIKDSCLLFLSSESTPVSFVRVLSLLTFHTAPHSHLPSPAFLLEWFLTISIQNMVRSCCWHSTTICKDAAVLWCYSPSHFASSQTPWVLNI